MEMEPFRFLDLPVEIRLMIYERLPRTIKHHRIEINHPIYEHEQVVTLVVRSIPVSILGANRQIYNEAQNVIRAIAESFILKASPQMLVVTDSYSHVLTATSGLSHRVRTLQQRSSNELLRDR
jgi:ferritin-like metal-binding protein YciE